MLMKFFKNKWHIYFFSTKGKVGLEPGSFLNKSQDAHEALSG